MENLQKSIKDKNEYMYASSQNSIHVGYGIDENYARCCATSIASFCINNRDIRFTFHILNSGFSNQTKEKFDSLAKQFAINIILYSIDTSYLKKLPTQTHLPLPTYFRFILPLVLEDVDTLFYIDADIICLKNARELFSINLENNIIAAVPDLPRMNKKRNKALNLQEHIYFNAGMLVININSWNQYDILDKMIDMITTNPRKFSYLDQDALNLILTKKVKYLGNKFNCIDIDNINKRDIVLLHLAAHPKPWNIAFPISKMCNDFNRNLYRNFENQTPWENTPLEQPKNYKEMKNYAKALRYNKQYLKSIYWDFKYLLTKY